MHSLKPAGAPGPRTVEVWNKLDLLDARARTDVAEQAARVGALAVSAATGEGLNNLTERLSGMVDDAPALVFSLEPSDGEALAWLYRHGRVTSRVETGEATLVLARLDSQALGQFEQMRPSISGRPPA